MGRRGIIPTEKETLFDQRGRGTDMGNEYVDIFATKGIEYLLIAFLLTLVLFWRVLNKPKTRVAPPGANNHSPAVPVEWFELADDRYFHQGHSWVMPEDQELVTVGIDDFAQKLLGKATAIVLPPVGSHVAQGEVGWRFQFDTASIDLLSPVNGDVVAINGQVTQSPLIVNQDPYGNGWLLKVRVPKLRSNLSNLLHGVLASAWMRETVNRLRQGMSGKIGPVLQDGGVPVIGFAKSLAGDAWKDFAAGYLLSPADAQTNRRGE